MPRILINVMISLFILGCSNIALGQDEIPREFVPEDELISLSDNLDFGTALDLLSEYAVRFAGKPIYDPTKQMGTIGIDIAAMPWEKALQTILGRRGLWYAKKEHFIQIVVPDPKEGSIAENKSQFQPGIYYKTGCREVKIETIFFEGDRKALSEIGIDWSTFYRGKVNISADQAGTLSMNEKMFNLKVLIPNQLYNIDVRLLFNLFDSKNIGRVLAQPQVMVTEGNEGKIQVGQDFSIKTRDFAGNLMDRFYSTGTILEVIPYVIDDPDKGTVVLLKAHVERSQAFPDVITTIIKKSQANSFVQLFDGEETLIAGLYTTERTSLRKGLPLVKDLPWWVLGLRYIFGYNRFEESQKELIIILKASLLPDVYTRKAMGSTNSGARSTLEQRLQQYRISNNPQQQSELQDVHQTSKTEKQPPDTVAVNKANHSQSQSMDKTNSSLTIHQKSAKEKSSAAHDSSRQFTTESLAERESVIPLTTGHDSVVPLNEKPKPIMVNAKKTSQNTLYGGVVQAVQDELVLISWEDGFNPSILLNQILPVFRKNPLTARYEPIAKIQVLRAQEQRSVARKTMPLDRNGGKIQVGDKVVVKTSD